MKKKRPQWSRSLLIMGLLLLALISGFTLQIIYQLPDVNDLNTYMPNETTIIYSNDNKVLARMHNEENRQVVPLSRISPYLQKCVIAIEDNRFYQHHGFDAWGIVRAGVKNLIYGRVVEGGSTLTQQLARNIYLTRKKTFGRKLAEVILALQLERRFTKEEILEMYLNQVYFGHNSYGVESAANLYFGKTSAELDLAESAILAGLIRGPEIYSPYRNEKAAKSRQIMVLNKALEHHLISEEEAKQASLETLNLYPKNLKRMGEIAPYFTSYILSQLIEQFGEDIVYHGGLKVYTTLDSNMQIAAESVINTYVTNEGPQYHFSQAALVSIDPRTGYIKAMVGGADFFTSKFNRAIQSKRQPGSAFKPFVYTAAIEQGISPATILMDSPTTFKVYPSSWNPDGSWAPNNFDKKFRGAVTMRYALEKSLNIPSIKLLERVGIDSTIDVARRMGIKSHLEPGLSLSLGASEVTLMELTSAYGTFANSGIWAEPISIIRIEDRSGVLLYKSSINDRRAIDSNVSAIMVDMMKGVLSRGTGVRGRINRPAAAKTGTTQDFHDAWFMGFVPQLVTGVWVGNDDNTPMQGVAEVAVCPRIWKDYNQIALAGLPVLDFPKPEGLNEGSTTPQKEESTIIIESTEVIDVLPDGY